ncbi:HAMP domain-containing histidine kinase [Parabacteroides sp. BX2]|uniref:histidine kinase n=1 Tax=Parabacteroides segnis TaxID=2763058 RepID=A0ABR7DZU4_9BACT|nr:MULTISPECIES: HAMP domain-containing sensor histidine kinase [Parabacteroides]MBC5643040.1 HAMP domain-containing histidine kinase [Parabacteroides segnis]MCM0714984.1 HAMP domain-containing histidine kinase [Parabacteroides sp. TA-V-105]
MKIRTALTLKNTGVTATVFLLCMILIYLVSEQTRDKTFFRDLKSEGITKAHLFLADQVDARIMQSIYLNNRKFINEVEVAVYTTDFQMLYHDAIQNDIIKETQEMINDILRKKEIEFHIGKYQGVGMVYPYRGKEYIVTAAAYDGYGYDNLIGLQKTLFILFIVGLSLLFITGYFLARVSLQPIRNIVNEAETITASQIDRRLPVKNEKDELGELSTAFNALLNRLEISFNSQRMFVSNVSHELRTPLSALIAELGLSLQKERTTEQYRYAMQNMLQDARRMTRLIDGLLNLAKADYRKEEISMRDVRLDELLLDVRELILRAHPEYHIDLLFGQEEADDDRLITTMGNPYLLNIAFSNLIENNCKYSGNNTSSVQISFWDRWTIIHLSDNGIGMSEIDKQNLFTLFYRGEDEKIVEGHGIGMALSQKIIRLHGGEIAVHSERGEGTTFVVKLPHV